jgi:hypothetical protein
MGIQRRLLPRDRSLVGLLDKLTKPLKLSKRVRSVTLKLIQ